MTFDESVDQLREQDAVAAKWVEVVADMAGTTDADWMVFATAGNLLAEFERSVQGVQSTVEGLRARVSAM